LLKTNTAPIIPS